MTISPIMKTFIDVLAAAAEEEGPAAPSNVGVGSVVLTVAVAGFLVWIGYLVLSSRRRARRVEETPQNLSPFLSDDEMETKRVTRVLNLAVISAAVLAVALPIYYINEGDRQTAAAERIHERNVSEGSHWYENFSCVDCHGPGGSGGGAPFVEARSTLSTTWNAPSLNDIFFRYSPEEIEHWIVYGRPGTPMPANGLEGGGAMTVEEVEQVMDYLYSVSITQGQALDEVEGAVTAALDRISRGDAAVARRILEQEAVLADTLDAVDKFAAIEDLPGEVRAMLAGDGTCTPASAALVGSRCGEPGTDTDRDGLSDAAETRLTEMGVIVDQNLLVRSVRDQTDDEGAPVTDPDGNPLTEVVTIPDPSIPEVYNLNLDPENAFTNESVTGTPIPDLDRFEIFLTELDTAHLTLGVTAERLDLFTESVQSGIDFLYAAAEDRLWDIDFEAVSTDSGLSAEDTERAVGLYNAYCARCHTAGYSAGVIFEQGPGTGAWGPALTDGRSVVQFPDPAEQEAFIATGSDDSVHYGINGLGSGRMPGFGQILSAEDIALIVAYERTL